MFVTIFVTLALAIGIATVLLVGLGHRIRFSFALAGWLLGAAILVGAGELLNAVWGYPPEPILVAQVTGAFTVAAVCVMRRQWNPIGQAFFGIFIAAAGTYVAFAVYFTFGGALPAAGVAPSIFLLLLEVLALSLSGYFVFEGCDVICRTKPARPEPQRDPSYMPMVSLQVPAYNEPPDMLIETIRSLEQIDYPNLEIIVIDNNTEDPDLWRPVEEYCRERPRLKFIHVEGLAGFKAGALNLVNREHIDPGAEVIGVVDADYCVDPVFLRELVGYFADPKVAFVQTPQDYREWKGDGYMTSCYDAYNYFFVTSMPSRMQRNSIIFAGTMGLIRRSALEEAGGWPEWCITEDAETSLRLLKRGYEGVYVNKRFGNGIMPLTFSTLKSQRFRWAFGGIQIFRKHFRDLIPGRRTAENQLTIGQRVDYLMSGVLWFNDVLYLGFAMILFGTAFLVAAGGQLEVRPLRGAIALLPLALIASGVVRALWSLRVRAHIGLKRGIFAFLNWLSLSWTVALACLQHLFRSESTFLRTPKEGKERTLRGALKAARTETAFAVLLWGAPVILAFLGRGTPFLFTLFAWQGLVYASAPFMSWLNVRAELSPELERRRRTETRRERLAALAPYYAGASAVVVVVFALFAVGGSQPAGDLPDLLEPPARSESGPLAFVRDRVGPASEDGEGPGASTPSPSAPAPAEEPQATTTPEPTVAPVTEAPATASPTPTPAATTSAPAAMSVSTAAP